MKMAASAPMVLLLLRACAADEFRILSGNTSCFTTNGAPEGIQLREPTQLRQIQLPGSCSVPECNPFWCSKPSVRTPLMLPLMPRRRSQQPYSNQEPGGQSTQTEKSQERLHAPRKKNQPKATIAG